MTVVSLHPQDGGLRYVTRDESRLVRRMETFRCLAIVVVAVCAFLATPSNAAASVIGSNLARGANESVCRFQSFEPSTAVCTVYQKALQLDHTASDGLLASSDGVVVRWSVISGPTLPGTGSVRLALRVRGGPGEYLQKGPEVQLPLGSQGARHTFLERLPISAGEPVGLWMAVSNHSTKEAGVPLAYGAKDVGVIDIWQGEPWESTLDGEEDIELLLDAEIEPDEDEDGYGDLTQDCFPHHPGDQELCGLDLTRPKISPRFAARQNFLRSGTVAVRVGSNEAGVARASGRLVVEGGRTYRLRGVRRPIAAGGVAALRLRVPRLALRAARRAVRENRRILVKIQVGVMDAARNAREATVEIRPPADTRRILTQLES
jgi:hypothetical protein